MYQNNVKKLRELFIDHYVELIAIPDDLLELALTKYSNNNNFLLQYGSTNYNRFEFFGDAILDMIVTEMLFYDYLIASEGKLTQMRSLLVNNVSLACFADYRNLCSLTIPFPETKKNCADV